MYVHTRTIHYTHVAVTRVINLADATCVRARAVWPTTVQFFHTKSQCTSELFGTRGYCLFYEFTFLRYVHEQACALLKYLLQYGNTWPHVIKFSFEVLPNKIINANIIRWENFEISQQPRITLQMRKMYEMFFEQYFLMIFINWSFLFASWSSF